MGNEMIFLSIAGTFVLKLWDIGGQAIVGLLNFGGGVMQQMDVGGNALVGVLGFAGGLAQQVIGNAAGNPITMLIMLAGTIGIGGGMFAIWRGYRRR